MDAYCEAACLDTLAKQPALEDTLKVRNPYNNALISTIVKDNALSVSRAIERGVAYDYGLTAWQRYEMLHKFCELLLHHADEIVHTISLESGKTIKDARAELKRAHQAFLISAEEAKRISGEMVPVDAAAGTPAGMAMVLREPLGLVAAITPFNFPLNMIAHKVGPALAANNPVVVKPAESTPLTALKIEELLLQAGVPSEMIQVVVGNPVEMVDQLVSDPRIQKISFTGSVAVGKAICQKAGMKAVCMELGGNDPMIVLEDADLDLALNAGIDGAFGHNGQRCTAVKRFIVHNKIADEFIERFITASKELRVGDQMNENTDIGPLIHSDAAIAIEQRVKKSVAAGAKLLYGGHRNNALLYPTVLDHVDMRNPIVKDETFGPVAPFIRVSDFDEAIQVANDTHFGLQSGVFTKDLDKAMQAIKRIQAGAVMINKPPGFRAEHLPFGGIKDSGIGREGIKYAVESMTHLKTAVI